MGEKRSGKPIPIIIAVVLAVGGLCFCFGVSFVGAVFFPVFSAARERARSNACMENLKKLSTGLIVYAEDYDGKLPPASQWGDAIRPYTAAESEKVYRCPSVAKSGYGYAMNSRLSRQSLKALPNAAQTPMLYDSSNLSWNAHDPLTSLPNPPRHRGNNLAFADGHVEHKPEEDRP